MEGIKHDDGKVRTDLLAWDAIEECAKVMTFGARKYDDRNYYGLPQSRLFGAVIRHLMAWWLRKGPDPETGQSHLAHAMAGCMMLLEKELNRLGEDDRPGVIFGEEPIAWMEAEVDGNSDFPPIVPEPGVVSDALRVRYGRYQRADKSDTDYEGSPR